MFQQLFDWFSKASANTFVYEDLVLQVVKIQNQINQTENILSIRYENDKQLFNEFKSRSFIFVDPYGNRITKKYFDHELVEKVLIKYKKDYVPEYLQQWIEIGFIDEHSISNLNHYDLQSSVEKFPDNCQFITYGQVSVHFQSCFEHRIQLKVLLTDDINEIKKKL